MIRQISIGKIVQFLLFLLVGVCAVLYFLYRFGWLGIPAFMIKGEEGKAMGRAVAAYRYKDYAAAAQEYRTYLESSPDDPEAWYGLAISLGQLGDKEEAMPAALRARQLVPAERKYRGVVALLHIGLGEFPQAIKIYDDLLAEKYHDQGSLANRAFAYHRWGKESAALDHYQLAVKEFPNSPDLHYTLGVLYHKQKQYDAALKHLTEASHLNLKYEEAYLLMAKCSIAKGDKQEAAYQLERCLVLANKDNLEVIEAARALQLQLSE
jgi:tetratricopeptide (TPR) repeat protein